MGAAVILLKSQQTLRPNTLVWSWVPGLAQPQLFTCTLPPPSPGSQADRKVCSAFDLPAVCTSQATFLFLSKSWLLLTFT